MTFSDWLDAEPGRPTTVAAHFNVTISAVSQWRENGVPRKRMHDVRDLSAGAVSVDEMVAHVRPAKVAA